MPRYIGVVHGWHVVSNGFDVHELKANDHEGAYQEARFLSQERDKAFDRTAWTVIEIDDQERFNRRLTWRERFSGIVKF